MFTGIFLDPCDRPPEGMISTGNRFGPRHHWDFDIYWIEKTTPPPGWGVMPFQPPPEGMEATEEWVYGVRHMDQYKYCADYFAKTRDVQLVVVCVLMDWMDGLELIMHDTGANTYQTRG